MAKKPNITTIASGYYSRLKLNENFENLRNGFENTLSLDGSTPNAMQADLDFNNNNAINVASLDAQTITLGGSTTDLSDIQALTGISQDIQTLADIEDGTEATDAIQTAASVSSEISVVSGVSSDVTTVAAIDTDVSTVAGVSSDVSTVASNISDVTNFADVYLGPAASDPATRNDGSPLQEGDLYFNTNTNLLFVYNGSAFQTSPTPFSTFATTLIDDETAQEARQTLGLKGGATTEFFDDVSALLADTGSYTDGTIIRTRSEGFAYEVVTSDEHVTTAGGMKLKVLPGESGYNVKAFGAKGDSITDDTSALNAAFASGGRYFFVPEGTYFVTDMLTLPAGVTMRGAGKGVTIFDASSSTTSSTFIGHNTHIAVGEEAGVYTSLPSLSVDLEEGNDLVEFSTAHNMEKGDVFYVRDPRDGSLTNYRANYRMGDLFEVDQILSSTKVRVTKPHRFPLTAANSICKKHAGERGGGLLDFTILCFPDENTLQVGIKVAGVVNYSIKNVEVRDPHYVGIVLIAGCYDWVVSECTVLGTADSPPNDESLQYGIKPGSSSRGRIINNYVVAGRHAIDGGAGGSLFEMCTTDIIIANNDTHSPWSQSISAHGDCIGWHMVGNKATGFSVRGGDHIIADNEVTLRKDTEGEIGLTPFTFSEIWSPTNKITNNKITVYDPPGTFRGWLIDWAGNSGNLTADTYRDGVVRFTNNLVFNKIGTPITTSVIEAVNRGAVGITIGLEIKGNAIYSEYSGNSLIEAEVDTGDDIWDIMLSGNSIEKHSLARIKGAKVATIERNKSVNAGNPSDLNMGKCLIEAAKCYVSNNIVQDCGDQAFYVFGTAETVVVGNQVNGYHLISATGSTVLNGGIAARVDDGGIIVLKDNVCMNAGPFAPGDTYEVFSGGTPSYIFVAGNVDTDQGGFDFNGLTVHGPEENNLSLISGVTRHELTAPSGTLEIDGTVVGTQT